MIKAWGLLIEDFVAFQSVYRHYVKVSLPDEQIETIWRQERDYNGFAIDGAFTAGHWRDQIELFYALNALMPRVGYGELIEPRFVDGAIRRLEDRQIAAHGRS